MTLADALGSTACLRTCLIPILDNCETWTTDSLHSTPKTLCGESSSSVCSIYRRQALWQCLDSVSDTQIHRILALEGAIS